MVEKKAVMEAGQRFGMLTAIENTGRKRPSNNHGSKYYWKFKCDCGNYVEKVASDVKRYRGKMASCGCFTSREDYTGKTFGRWTIIGVSAKRGNEGQNYWKGLCECGNIKDVLGTTVKSGKSFSCGCYSRETTSKVFKTHGKTRQSIYHTYNNMLARILDKGNIGYENYGGRGIKVCDRRLESFENFLEDMGEKPSSLHTLERVNVNGNYCPENCIWIERQYQGRNQRQRKDNSSGTVGVHKQLKGKYEYWTAQWNNLSKKRCGKQFNCATYGEELAFFMACEYREQQINLLNLQGAGYTEGHGKVKSITEVYGG